MSLPRAREPTIRAMEGERGERANEATDASAAPSKPIEPSIYLSKQSSPLKHGTPIHPSIDSVTKDQIYMYLHIQ